MFVKLFLHKPTNYTLLYCMHSLTSYISHSWTNMVWFNYPNFQIFRDKTHFEQRKPSMWIYITANLSVVFFSISLTTKYCSILAHVNINTYDTKLWWPGYTMQVCLCSFIFWSDNFLAIPWGPTLFINISTWHGTKLGNTIREPSRQHVVQWPLNS